MNRRLAALLLSAATCATAHRLDEYLQATLISIEKDRVEAQIRLTPGVAVVPFVLAGIDTNGDGVISEIEQRAYGDRVLRDLSLTMDGGRLTPRLVSMAFPKIDEMKEGLGEIQLVFQADLPRDRANRTLTFENHHHSRIAAYQVNCLVPRDPDIRVIAQNRNYVQSFYQLDYAQAGVAWWSASGGWMGGVALLLFARFTMLWRQRPNSAA